VDYDGQDEWLEGGKVTTTQWAQMKPFSAVSVTDDGENVTLDWCSTPCKGE
jgi:hypothetical protein